MATSVREVMTADPVVLETTATVSEAARCMRDEGIGDVLVTDGATLRGIVTDRDLTTRVLAADRDGSSVTLGDVVTTGLEAVEPDADVSEVIDRMRRAAVRRVPVVENNVPVGILSIGDLAVQFDDDSVLADLSAAPPDEQA